MLFRSNKPQIKAGRRRARAGFTLIEAMFTLLVFALATVMFAAIFPVSFRSSGKSADYIQAAIIARHKMDQIRQAGYTHLDGASLKGLQIVDSDTPDANGFYSFAATDGLVNKDTLTSFFGDASNCTATIKIVPALSVEINGVAVPTVPTPPADRWAKQVTVHLSWSGRANHSGDYTAHTIIASP